MIVNYKNIITLNYKQLLGGFIISVLTFVGLIIGFRYNNDEVYYQVIFDSNGGSEVAGQNILIGNKVAVPSNTVREGYIFKGWYLGKDKYDFATNVRKDMILKAKWEKIEDIINNNKSSMEEKKNDEKKSDSTEKKDNVTTNNTNTQNSVNTVIGVSGVSLNTTSISLKVGDSTTLRATVQPANATNKTLSWSSSNNSVATVSNGVIKAVSSGTAVITVSVGGKSASCTVTVPKNITYNYEIVDIPSSSVGQCYVYIKRSDGVRVSGVIEINYINGAKEELEISASGVMKVRSTISSVRVISAG